MPFTRPTPCTTLAARRLIVGTSDVADHVRNYPWAESPLGPIETWSASLLGNVNLVLNSSAALALYWGPEMIYIQNERSMQMLGPLLVDPLGLPASEHWGEEWHKVKDRFEAVINLGESYHYQNVPLCFARAGKTSELFINYSLSPIHHEGRIVGIFRALEDTTETVLAMRALAESNERLRMALSVGNGFGVWEWHIQSGLVFADERIASLYGLDPQLAATGVSHLYFERQLHPDDLKSLTDAVMECLLTHQNYSVEYRVRREDGSYRWIRSMGQCILDSEGHPYRITGLKTEVQEPSRRDPATSAAAPLAAAFSGEPWDRLPASIRTFLAGTVYGLTDRPGQIRLEVTSAPGETRLLLRVPADDVGKIIGKQGRIMRSLRTVLLGISGTSGHRYSIDVVARE